MNSEELTAEAAGPAGTAPNLIQRVIMVFGSPGNLGESLRQRPLWFWTLAIVALISMVIFLLLPESLLEAAMQARAAQRGQTDFDPEAALRFARIGGAVGALLGTFIAAAVIAGVIYLAFNVLLGGESTYKQHLSATSHIYWINLLGFLVLVPIWISQSDMQVRLGLGLLLPQSPSSFFGHFLNSITIFGLWSSAALGAIESGLSGGRISIGKAVGVVLALYFVWVVVSAAWATVTGGM